MDCKQLLVQVNCHPWNQTVGKGGSNNKLGYACLLFTEYGMGGGHATFIDRDWGTCECHTEMTEPSSTSRLPANW